MTTKSREERATQFIKQILPTIREYLEGDIDYNVERRIETALQEFCTKRHRTIGTFSGASRIVFVSSDYAVKFDKRRDHTMYAGNCEDELRAYEFAKEKGFEYLFAEVTKATVKGFDFYIMPRVDTSRNYCEYSEAACLSDEEVAFLNNYFTDLHAGNYGYIEDEPDPLIIDYAWNYVPRTN